MKKKTKTAMGIGTAIIALALANASFAEPPLPSGDGGSTNNAPIDWDAIQAQLRQQFTNNFPSWLHPNALTGEGLANMCQLCQSAKRWCPTVAVVEAVPRQHTGGTGTGRRFNRLVRVR